MLVTHLSVVLRYRLTTISGECDKKVTIFGATALYAVAPFY